MAENDVIYWQRWQKLFEAAANIQGLLPGTVMIGGSAAAIHPLSFKFQKSLVTAWSCGDLVVPKRIKG